MHGRRMIAKILGRGYVRIQEMLSPTGFAILSSIFSDIRPQQWLGVGSHLGADKGTDTPLFETVATSDLLLMVKFSGKVCGNE